MSSIYCNVLGCRYPHAHSTSAHKCGGCDDFGHGQMECGDSENIAALVLLEDRLLPNNLQCTMPGCMYPETHNIASHHCRYCLQKNHGERDCIIKEMTYYHGKYVNLEHDLRILDNVFFKELAGMGSVIYVRKKNGYLMFLLMHGDNWGQYGERTSDVPRLNKFIEGLREVNDDVVERFEQFSIPVAAIDPSNINEIPRLRTPGPGTPEIPENDFEINDEIDSMIGNLVYDTNTDIVPTVTMTGSELNQTYHDSIFYNEVYGEDLINLQTSSASVKCPLCRTMNDKSKVTKIKGLSVECSVCLSNNVTLYFPECEHACVCQKCFDQL